MKAMFIARYELFTTEPLNCTITVTKKFKTAETACYIQSIKWITSHSKYSKCRSTCWSRFHQCFLIAFWSQPRHQSLLQLSHITYWLFTCTTLCVSAVFATATCLSIRLSVCHSRYCV